MLLTVVDGGRIENKLEWKVGEIRCKIDTKKGRKEKYYHRDGERR